MHDMHQQMASLWHSSWELRQEKMSLPSDLQANEHKDQLPVALVWLTLSTFIGLLSIKPFSCKHLNA